MSLMSTLDRDQPVGPWPQQPSSVLSIAWEDTLLGSVSPEGHLIQLSALTKFPSNNLWFSHLEVFDKWYLSPQNTFLVTPEQTLHLTINGTDFFPMWS